MIIAKYVEFVTGRVPFQSNTSVPIHWGSKAYHSHRNIKFVKSLPQVKELEEGFLCCGKFHISHSLSLLDKVDQNNVKTG